MILLAWQPRNQGDAERKLWGLAVIARQSGDLTAAQDYLARLVELRPEQARFRSELASVSEARDQQDQTARRVQQADMRSDPRARLAAERVFSTRLTFAISPQTNPAQRTDAEVITILGLPFRLANGVQQKSATGVTVGARFTWSPMIAEGWRARISFGGNATLYEDEQLNDISASLDAGLVHVTMQGLRLEGGVSYQKRWLGGKLYSRGPGLSFGLSRAVGVQGDLTISGQVQWLSHPFGPMADGPRAALKLGYSHRLSPQTALRGSLRFDKTNAEIPSLSLQAVELGLGFTHAFRGGITLGGDLALRQSQHEGGTLLFPQARVDRRASLRLRMMHARLSWNGYAPVVEFEATRQSSNVPVNSFRNLGVSLGLTRSF
jgi:hypothetical protein